MTQETAPQTVEAQGDTAVAPEQTADTAVETAAPAAPKKEKAPLAQQTGEDVAPSEVAEISFMDVKNKIAGEDTALAKRLERLGSFENLGKTLAEADKALSNMPKPFPAEGTPEEQNKWRKANGIPENPDDYVKAFGEGFMTPDGREADYKLYYEAMHKLNASPELVKTGLDVLNAVEENYAQTARIANQQYAKELEDTLREEWGPEYRQNTDAIKGFLSRNAELAAVYERGMD